MTKTLVLSAVVYASINASVLSGFQNLSQGYKHRMSSNAKACIFIANVANYLLEIVSITQKEYLFFSRFCFTCLRCTTKRSGLDYYNMDTDLLCTEL